MKVGEPVTGLAGPAVGGATTGGEVVVVVGGAVVVVVGAAVVVVVVVVVTGCHCAYNVSMPEFGNVYVSSPL